MKRDLKVIIVLLIGFIPIYSMAQVKNNNQITAVKANRLPLSDDQTKTGYSFVVPTAKVEPSVWRYTLAEPDSTTWFVKNFDDTQWQEGKSAFGTKTTPGTDDILNTEWNTHDIWIRRAVKLPAKFNVKNLYLIIHHDNGAEVYIDGISAWRNENIETRKYEIFEISNEAKAKLKPGKTVTFAVHGHNGAGGQVIDVGLVSLK